MENRKVSHTSGSPHPKPSAPYEEKFAGLIKLITENNGSKIECIIISEPWVIGDKHEEMIESLSLLAGTDLALHIVQREISVMNA
jgi:hypothetical protein